MKNTISCQEWKHYLVSADNHLFNCQSEINTLNFFPVPDADTGTNMYMTFNSGINAIKDYSGSDLSEMSLLLGEAILYGAKGNSGVILSQIIEGFTKTFKKSKEITAVLFANALILSKKLAYEAVLTPIEGTILTVVSAAANFSKAFLHNKKDLVLEVFFTKLADACLEAAHQTREMMPELNKQKLIDSGAMGFYRIIQAFKLVALGMDVEINKKDLFTNGSQNEIIHGLSLSNSYGYCTEFFINLHETHQFKRNQFCSELENLNCNSIVCFQVQDKVKVHAHTLQPGNLLNLAQTLGSLNRVKIDNMSLQALEAYKPQVSRDDQPTAPDKKPYGVIAVARGQGLLQVLEKFEIDYIIFLSHSSNLTAKLINQVVVDVNCEKIFFFANSKFVYNFIKQLLKTNDDLNKKIILLNSFSFVSCLQSLFSISDDKSLNDALITFNEICDNVKYSITCNALQWEKYHSCSDAEKTKIHSKEFTLQIGNNKLVECDSILESLKIALKELVVSDNEILTIIYGASVNSAVLQSIKTYINDNYSLELELIYGQQVDNCLIIGVE